MSGRGDGLLLPDHVERERQETALPTPTCADCKQPLMVGDTISSIVAGVGPGMLQMVPVHMSCVLKVDEEEPTDGD